jgi:cytochrome c5
MDLIRNAAMAVGILFCIGLIGAQFVGGGADDGAEVDAAEQEAAMGRISPVASVAVTGSAPAATEAATPAEAAAEEPAAAAEPAAAEPAAAPAEPVAAAGNGETLYNQTCFACHNTGAAGAPKIGDVAAWEPRIATGMDALVNSAVNGKNAMPAKGGNMGLSDDSVKDIVEYMVSKAQ